MHHDQSRDPAPTPQRFGDRARFTGPRLELPRFQFAPAGAPAAHDAGAARSVVADTPAPFATPAPVMRMAAPPLLAPAARRDLQPAQPPAWMQAPAPRWHEPRPAPVQHVTYAAPVPATPVVARPAYTAPASPSPFANATRPAQVTWEGGGATAEPTLLQRITPVHMGALLMMVIVAMVVTSGPAAMNAKPGRLPALASGGGVGVDGMPIRAGSTAIAATTATSGAQLPRLRRAEHGLPPHQPRRVGADPG